MLYAGIDIHKTVFQAVVLDPDTGELSESRFAPSRERFGEWAGAWQGKPAAVAIESTTGQQLQREDEREPARVELVRLGAPPASSQRSRASGIDQVDLEARARGQPTASRRISRSRRPAH